MRLRSSRILLLVSSVLIPLSFVRTSAAQEPSPTPSPEPGASPAPVAAAAPASSKVFNPDIAVIGDFLGAIGKNDSPSAPPSLEMHEAEASLQAIVDPYARADFFLAFAPDEVRRRGRLHHLHRRCPRTCC